MFDGLEVIAKIKCWVEIKKRKWNFFSELMHCYSPTPAIGRRRPKNNYDMQCIQNYISCSETGYFKLQHRFCFEEQKSAN